MSPNKYNGGSLILFCGTHGTDKWQKTEIFTEISISQKSVPDSW